jgi:hypothetical protein
MKSKLIKESFTNSEHKNFVFTSCGNNTKFHELWGNDNRNYDIYAIYYKDDPEIFDMYKNKVNYIESRKGSKFQNFHYFYNKYPDIINKYERFFILDDDIIFNTDDINEMFKISKEYGLWICGPSFSNDGSSKISWSHTKHEPHTLLRYTNFIEVNVPLFNKYALTNLMKYYDPVLIGWGIDYLFMWANGEHKDKYAIIDKIVCINPHDNKKNNKRELNNINNVNIRNEIWEQFRKKNSIPKLLNAGKIYKEVEL